MKTQVALISLLALAGVALFFQGQSGLQSSQSTEVFQAYQAYNQKYNSSRDIDMYRLAVFTENYNHIIKHNQSNSSVKLGVNQFAALTLEEFKTTILNQNRKSVSAPQERKLKSGASIPDSIDWVAKGAVNKIQDQGNCGSCWAFSAVTSLESANQISEGTLQKFSEQQVTSCAPFPNMGCNGGMEDIAMNYVAKNGIELEKTYPYVQQSNPKTAACNYEKSKTVWSNKGSASIKKNSPNDMMERVAEQPISIAVDAGNITFQLYSSGTLTSENCGTSLDHAIAIVGYNNSDSTPYWIIRNSWGTSWGLKGYAHFAIIDGPGVCGCQMEPVYPTV